MSSVLDVRLHLLWEPEHAANLLGSLLRTTGPFSTSHPHWRVNPTELSQVSRNGRIQCKAREVLSKCYH